MATSKKKASPLSSPPFTFDASASVGSFIRDSLFLHVSMCGQTGDDECFSAMMGDSKTEKKKEKNMGGRDNNCLVAEWWSLQSLFLRHVALAVR